MELNHETLAAKELEPSGRKPWDVWNDYDKPWLSKTYVVTPYGRKLYFSGNNVILDGHIRVEKVGHPKCDEARKIWIIWGYQWHKETETWGELQFFICRSFEMEDEPI